MSASDRCQVIYRMAESLRDEWADIMLFALKQNGHVILSDDEYARLKGEIMQLLTGRMRI